MTANSPTLRRAPASECTHQSRQQRPGRGSPTSLPSASGVAVPAVEQLEDLFRAHKAWRRHAPSGREIMSRRPSDLLRHGTGEDGLPEVERTKLMLREGREPVLARADGWHPKTAEMRAGAATMARFANWGLNYRSRAKARFAMVETVKAATPRCTPIITSRGRVI